MRKVSPRDLQAQIQQLIDRERTPAGEIKAVHAELESVTKERARFQQMAARDLITLDELKVHGG